MLLLVSGCGSDGGSETDTPPAEPGPAAGTALTIEVVADTQLAAEGADPRTLTLTCDPAGGDHPQPDEACAALEAAGAEVFEPVPDDQACTMIYGGPQGATVIGTFEGEKVNGTFSRENGCEIDRWEQLGTTFFDLPLQ